MKGLNWGFIIAVLLILRFKPGTPAVTAGQNGRHFGIFCRIRLGTQIIVEHSSSLDLAGQCLDTIEKINIALLRKGGLAESAEEQLNHSASAGSSQSGIRRDKNSGLTKAENDRPTTISTEFPPLELSPASGLLLRKRISKVEEKAKKVYQIARAEDFQNSLREARQYFNRALWGEKNVTTDSEKIAGSRDRKTTCAPGTSAGNSGSAKVGESLILDSLCLCAMESGQLDQACGEAVSWSGGRHWNPSNGDNGVSSWKIVADACDAAFPPQTASITQARQAITEFRERLASGDPGDTANTHVPGLFGTAVAGQFGANGCDGQAARGVCVQYGDGWKTKIRWLKPMEDGLTALDRVQNTSLPTIHRALDQLKMLQSRAEEIYEEAKTLSELEKGNAQKSTQNKDQKQNPSTPTDKVTAQESNGVSTATKSRFILPWTLLI